MPFSTDLQRRPSDHVVALEPPPGDRSAAGPGRLLCTLRLRAEDVDHVARLKPHLESRPDVVSARWLIGQNTPPPISTPPSTVVTHIRSPWSASSPVSSLTRM